MKNLFHKNTKQELVEDFLDYELSLPDNKGPKKIVNVLNFLAHNYTNEQFINELYRSLLEREPDSEEYNRYVNLLKSNKETRSSILHAFVVSPEAQKINIQIIGLENLVNPSFLFMVSLSFKKLYYFLIGH